MHPFLKMLRHMISDEGQLAAFCWHQFHVFKYRTFPEAMRGRYLRLEPRDGSLSDFGQLLAGFNTLHEGGNSYLVQTPHPDATDVSVKLVSDFGIRHRTYFISMGRAFFSDSRNMPDPLPGTLAARIRAEALGALPDGLGGRMIRASIPRQEVEPFLKEHIGHSQARNTPKEAEDVHPFIRLLRGLIHDKGHLALFCRHQYHVFTHNALPPVMRGRYLTLGCAESQILHLREYLRTLNAVHSQGRCHAVTTQETSITDVFFTIPDYPTVEDLDGFTRAARDFFNDPRNLPDPAPRSSSFNPQLENYDEPLQVDESEAPSLSDVIVAIDNAETVADIKRVLIKMLEVLSGAKN